MTELHPPENETDDTRTRLQALYTEHRDIDSVITHLSATATPDELLIKRLKKRKLLLKDRIAQLELMLVPDVPA